MAKTTEPTSEPGSVPESYEPVSQGKHYEAPALVEWGSIRELTAGGFPQTDDDDGFTGTASGGV